MKFGLNNCLTFKFLIMKKLFLFLTLFSIFSCSHDSQEDNLNSNFNSVKNQMLQRSSENQIGYENAKIFAKKYSDSLSIILDKIEDNGLKQSNAIDYSNDNLNTINKEVINQLGYEGSFEFSSEIDNSIINLEDIEKLDLSEREIFYLTKLYESYLNKDDKQLIDITNNYIIEVKTNKELESLSMCFALIDVNRDLFLENYTLKADANCARAALKDAVYSGCGGMIRGAIRGGLTGLVIGGNQITGGAGAVVGAVSHGLIGFIGGGIEGYVRCKTGL